MNLPGSCRFLVVLACGAAFLTVRAPASTPSFSLTASNVTLPGGGNPGITHFTLASINGYAGKLVVNAQYSGSEMNAKPPNCGIHVAPLFTLNANSTVSGTLTCYPYGTVVPLARQRPKDLRYRGPVLALALAGWFVFRRRLRATAGRWLGLLVLGAIGAAGLAACGGNGLSGNYPFTITATDTVSQASVSTSITVTVP